MALTKQQEIIAGVGFLAILAFFAFSKKEPSGEEAKVEIMDDDSDSDPEIPILTEEQGELIKKGKQMQGYQDRAGAWLLNLKAWNGRYSSYLRLRSKLQHVMEGLGGTVSEPIGDDQALQWIADLTDMSFDLIADATKLGGFSSDNMLRIPEVAQGIQFLIAVTKTLREENAYWLTMKAQNREAVMHLYAQKPQYTMINNTRLFQIYQPHLHQYGFTGPVTIGDKRGRPNGAFKQTVHQRRKR